MSAVRVNLWVDPDFSPETCADLDPDLPKDPLPSNWKLGYLLVVFASYFLPYADESMLKIKDFYISDMSKSPFRMEYMCVFYIQEAIVPEYIAKLDKDLEGKIMFYQVL